MSILFMVFLGKSNSYAIFCSDELEIIKAIMMSFGDRPKCRYVLVRVRHKKKSARADF